MSAASTEGHATHIAVTVDASEEGLALFRRAAQIAAAMNASLEATIVEDENLVNLAGLPFGRTFELTTGLSHNFDHITLDRATRAGSRRIREAHAAISREFRISCTTTSERTVSTARTVTHLSSLNRYVLTRGLPKLTAARRPIRRPAEERVLAVAVGDPAAKATTVQLAMTLAKILHGRSVFLMAKSDSDVARMIEDARRTAAHNTPRPLVEFAENFDIGRIGAAIDHYGATLAVLPRGIVGGSEANVKRLMDTAACALFFVRTEDDALPA